MPIYEYLCTACGRQVEVMHSISEQGPTECATCGGAMRKALSPPAILFKGSGWAKKDARAASSTASHSKPAEGSASGETGGKAGADATSTTTGAKSTPAGTKASATGSAD